MGFTKKARNTYREKYGFSFKFAERVGGAKKALAVLEKYKRRCALCSVEYSIKENRCNLLIHHIDHNGRRSEKPNNSIENLMLLCAVCHGKYHAEKEHNGIDILHDAGLT
jgi:predicted restriction endonuclease